MKNKEYLLNIKYIEENNLEDFIYDSILEHNKSLKKLIVQIGACYGKDLVHRIIDKYKIKSILLEPHPDNFKKLKKVYRKYKNIILDNVAISNKKERRKLFVYHNNSTEHNGIQLSSFLLRECLSHFDTSYIFVDCISFCDLLEKYNIGHIDFLQIDTEGYDYEIIKQIPFDKLKPSVIRFEIFYSEDESKDDDLTDVLQETGLNVIIKTIKMLENYYNIYRDSRNIIAVLKQCSLNIDGDVHDS